MSDSVETKLAVHEAVCSERYNSIDRSLRDGDKRMAKIEYLLYAVIVVVLLGPGVGADFFKHLFRL
jgi:predicted nucleic acid-binding Zn ribbon protein